MSWYSIKNYSYIRYADLNSAVQTSVGMTFIVADDSPFCLQMIGDERREYRLLKNDFCLIFPGAEYRIYTDPGVETRIMTLELESDGRSGGYHSLSQLCASSPEVGRLVRCPRSHLVACGDRHLKEIILLIQRIHEETVKQGSSSQVIDHLTAALLTQAAADIYGSSAGSPICIHTKKALSYISKNYQKDISLSDLAGQIGISSRRLQSLFKEELSTTFSEHLRAFRISRACDMLISTYLPINRISEAVGYNSRQHFASAFKQFCGTSPIEYRRNYKARNYRFKSEAGAGGGEGFLSFMQTKSDLDIDL